MLPIRIEMPEYIRKVKLSKKQIPKYFEWNGKILKAKGNLLKKSFFKSKDQEYVDFYHPKNLKNNYCLGIKPKTKGKKINKYEIGDIFTGKIVLCEIINEELIPIISNTNKVGTPRMYLISGQDIYSGALREHARGLVMDKIKEFYYPFIKGIPKITNYPVKILCEVHDTIKNEFDNHKEGLGQRWDIDNLIYPYLKAFPDLLVREGILKDDDRLHLSSSIGAIFVPVEKHSYRKLVFIIEKDERIELTENDLYKSYHKNKETYETEDLDLIKDELNWENNALNKET